LELVHTQRGEQVRDFLQTRRMPPPAAHPERFVRKPPQPLARPTEVWINPPPMCESAASDPDKKTP
jgi:hypothetical protein